MTSSNAGEGWKTPSGWIRAPLAATPEGISLMRKNTRPLEKYFTVVNWDQRRAPIQSRGSHSVPKPYAEQAQSHLTRDVPERLQGMSIPNKREGVQAERRERREPTQETDDDKCSSLIAPVPSSGCQESRDETNQNRSAHIDEKDPYWKRCAEIPLMNQMVQSVPRDASEGSTDADQEPGHFSLRLELRQPHTLLRLCVGVIGRPVRAAVQVDSTTTRRAGLMITGLVIDRVGYVQDRSLPLGDLPWRQHPRARVQ